jgi:hypothetical protein
MVVATEKFITVFTKAPLYNPDVFKLRGEPSPGGGACWSPAGAQVVCVRDIFILKEIWLQHKTYFLGTLLFGIFYLSLSTGTSLEL